MLSRLWPSAGQAVAFPVQNVTALPRHRSLAAGRWAGLGCCHLCRPLEQEPRESSSKDCACYKVARLSLCPLLPADHQLQLWERLRLWVQAPNRRSLPPHPGVRVTLPLEEARASARPERTSLLSRVCPSRAVNSDFNWIWVICCSNY